jgi:penicillin V acylase-like amidase (Ntn superfamily)
MKPGLVAAGILTTVLAVARPATPCTTFACGLGDTFTVGKSYDWRFGTGLVVVNKRRVGKRGFAAAGEPTPRWVSRYGSLTFNQFGREVPNGGINEAGLIVEIMWLESSVYPVTDTRPSLNELQWIQYQLDNRGSVAELIEHVDDIRVLPAFAKVHYLACDKTGACAALEYVDGQLRVSTEGALPVKVLTNNTYEDSFAALQKQKAGRAVVPKGPRSMDRFVRAASLLEEKGPESAAAHAFGILSSVSQGPSSQWNIVYEPGTRRVSFRSHDSPAIKSIDLNRFDFGCSTPVRILNVNDPEGGDATARFVDYTDAANLELVKQSFRQLGTPFPEERIRALAMAPAQFPCMAGN